MLDRLTPDYRQALLMTKLHGYSMAEAASQAGVSETAMKTRVHRAIRHVRRELEREAEVPAHPSDLRREAEHARS